jgi:hypothetical protein
MWNGTFFKRCTLKSLGLRIQLGHTLGDPCPNPATAAGDDFIIIGSHTVDEVGLDYCNCSRSKPRPIQLLRMRLYPATGTNPHSAATFAALDHFNLMSLESKCSAYEFYNSLARETDNTGLKPSQVSTRLRCPNRDTHRVSGALQGVLEDDAPMAEPPSAQARWART